MTSLSYLAYGLTQHQQHLQRIHHRAKLAQEELFQEKRKAIQAEHIRWTAESRTNAAILLQRIYRGRLARVRVQKALEFEQQMQELQDHWLCNSKRLHRAFKPEEFYGFDPFTATNPYV